MVHEVVLHPAAVLKSLRLRQRWRSAPRGAAPFLVAFLAGHGRQLRRLEGFRQDADDLHLLNLGAGPVFAVEDDRAEFEPREARSDQSLAHCAANEELVEDPIKLHKLAVRRLRLSAQAEGSFLHKPDAAHIAEAGDVVSGLDVPEVVLRLRVAVVSESCHP
jgi:hypothetical protein